MSAPDLTTALGDLVLPNPVMTAAGCAVAGRELEPFLDLAVLGAVVTRSVTLDPRAGHPPPRIVETPSGTLHGVGVQGPGLQGFLATELPWLAQRGTRSVVSIAAGTLGEYAELARRVGGSPGVSAVEVNLACADVEHPGREFGAEAYLTGKVLAVVRRDVPRGIPVLAKLRIGTDGIVEVARAAVKAGADGVVVGNPPRGLALDPVTLRPVLGGVTGDLSGPAVHPLALHDVWQLHRAMPDLPLVGAGGVRSGADALGMLAAGARAVQVGSAIFTDPSAPARILDELLTEVSTRGITDLAQLVGCAHREGEHP